MEKQLLHDESEWQSWNDCLGKWSGIKNEEKPKFFPCIVVWYEWDSRNSSWDNGVRDFVYLNDFVVDGK